MAQRKLNPDPTDDPDVVMELILDADKDSSPSDSVLTQDESFSKRTKSDSADKNNAKIYVLSN